MNETLRSNLLPLIECDPSDKKGRNKKQMRNEYDKLIKRKGQLNQKNIRMPLASRLSSLAVSHNYFIIRAFHFLEIRCTSFIHFASLYHLLHWYGKIDTLNRYI